MMRGNALSATIEEDAPLTIQLDGDAGMAGEEAAFFRSRVLPAREAILGAGLSVGAHAATVFFALLLPFFSVPHVGEEPSFITVSLVAAEGNGRGTEVAKNGAGEAGRVAGPLPPGSSHGPDTTLSKPSAADVQWEPRPVPDLIMVQAGAAAETAEIQHRPEHNLLEEPSPVQRKPSEGKKKRVAAAASKTTPETRSRATSKSPAASSFSNSIALPSHDKPPPKGDETAGDGNGGSGSAGSENTSGTGTGTGTGSSGGGISPAGAGSPSGEFSLKQVDQPPSPVRKVEPEFPLTARRLGTGGRVIVRFLVKPDGSVARASVIEAEPGGIFERSALDAVGKWKFKPGRIRGNAVATWVVLPIQFSLSR